ncbi:Alpha/Beta hydrolase protein [Rhexocercosporidium sp. MPI-PUGE-AT-0058]|nr:Alpha/Beta hydrolase protein [Rhexocercosporidium sp. MPI-PUGE-AT-0058]
MALNHPSLGRMRGQVSDDWKTIQYRGIQYADIPGRWQDPVLLHGPLNEDKTEFDATRHGASCPQHPGGHAFDLSLVGNVSLENEYTETSEFECLNLVVTVPKGVKTGDGLPVFVWVHGGGFSVGSSCWPQYDLERFVKTSIEIGRPVVGVSINYRLGIFGFLASDELNISGNYGLKDQACAFQWIHQNIAGFGGDPKMITAAGESAGAICISTLLLVNSSPLFNQAILMSGESTLRKARKMRWQNTHYAANAKLLSLESSTSEERRAMYEMSADEMVQKLPMFQNWGPCLDGRFIADEVDLGMLSDGKGEAGRPKWCEKLMIGDVAQDGTVLKARIMDNPTIMARLHDSLAASCHPDEGKRLLDSYGLSGKPSPEKQYTGLQQLCSDLRFYFPVLKTVEGWPNEKCFRYHFHQLNPVGGIFKGLASHELDVAYLLQNFPENLDAQHGRLGKDMAAVWINFTHGRGWDKENGEKEVLVVGPEEKLRWCSEKLYDEKFRHRRGKMLLEMGWEKCCKLGEMLQGVWDEKEGSSRL